MTNPESATREPAELIRSIEAELRSRDIDTLLMLSREDSDGVLAKILNTHVVAQTAIFFNATGKHIVLTGRTDAMAYEIFPFFDEIIAMEDEFEVEFLRVFERLAPRSVALNICEDDAELDGLRWGLYAQLQDILGEERLAALEVSSADLLRRVFA
ncbi:MAG TPA: hypothetical protein VKA06_07325 [Spirochaetia bacterium]|nr:hypothetical protein [Spirochaetia bacterium]